jgi:hypothetical protein
MTTNRHFVVVFGLWLIPIIFGRAHHHSYSSITSRPALAIFFAHRYTAHLSQ